MTSDDSGRRRTDSGRAGSGGRRRTAFDERVATCMSNSPQWDFAMAVEDPWEPPQRLPYPPVSAGGAAGAAVKGGTGRARDQRLAGTNLGIDPPRPRR